MTAPVAFVGAGPGDPGLLTRRGRDLLAKADAVVADRPSLAEICDLAPRRAERVLVGRTSGQPAWPLADIADLLAHRHRRGRRVVRLKSGDPYICSRTPEESDALQARSVPYEVIPGVSAATAAPAAAGIPAATPGGSFTVVAGNGDPASPPVDWPKLAREAETGGTLVVLMGRARQRRIATELVAAGADPRTPVVTVRHASRDDQAVRRGTLDDLAASGAILTLPPPTTLVIGRAAGLRFDGAVG